MLTSLVILNHQLAGSFVAVGQASLALLVLVLSYLMVSRIRFRSFKDLKIISRRALVAVTALGALTTVAFLARLHSAFLFVVILAAYLALGLGEEVIFYRRRKAEAEQKPEEEDSEDEVLEELGAFDAAGPK